MMRTGATITSFAATGLLLTGTTLTVSAAYATPDTTPQARNSSPTPTVLVIGADHNCDDPQVTNDYSRTLVSPIEINTEPGRFWVGNRCDEYITITPDPTANWGELAQVPGRETRPIQFPRSGGLAQMCLRPLDGPCWDLVFSPPPR